MTDALRLALAHWDASRTTANARLVDDIAAEAIGGWTPPSPEQSGFHRAWVRAVRDPVSRGWATLTLCAGLPAAERERSSMLAKRIEALDASGPDPRIARALLVLADADPGALANGRVRAAWERGLARSLDEPTGQAIRASRVGRAPDIAHVLDTLGGIRHPAAPLRRIEPGTTRPFGELPNADEILRLWRDALANPADDGPRAVLADLLLAVGDPRGELISIQLAGDGRERDHRIAELLAAHGHRWLGPLAAVAAAAQFRRGFVARLAINRATVEAHDAVVDDPIVATIEDLVPRSTPSDTYARWLASRALVSLRRVEVWDERTLDGVARRRAPLAHVAVPDGDGAWIASRVVPVCRDRGIRSLAVPAVALERLVAERALDAVDVVTVGGELRANLERWPQLPAHVALVVTRSAELERCNPTPWDARVELRRTAGEVHARIAGVWLLHSLDAALAMLPHDVARVEIADASNEIALRVATALAPRPVSVVPSRYASGNVPVTF